MDTTSEKQITSQPSALGDTPRTEEELFARMEKDRSEFYNTRLFSHPNFANKVKELWPKAFDGQTPKEWVEASLSVCKWVNALFAERNRELTAAQSRVKELEEQTKHWKHLNEAEKKKFDRENVSLQSELENVQADMQEEQQSSIRNDERRAAAEREVLALRAQLTAALALSTWRSVADEPPTEKDGGECSEVLYQRSNGQKVVDVVGVNNPHYVMWCKIPSLPAPQVKEDEVEQSYKRFMDAIGPNPGSHTCFDAGWNAAIQHKEST